MTWSDDSVVREATAALPAAEPGAPAGDAADAADPVIARIRRNLEAVNEIAARPLAEHADVYAALHTQLQGELAEIDGAAPA